MYFYGNIFCILFNSLLFESNVIMFQLLIGYLSYYFHNEYHKSNSIWDNLRIFIYLKNKHQLHHIYPRKNHFLLDPTIDIIFGTYY